jgi:glycerol-3-phosphate acyltransferase PlsX
MGTDDHPSPEISAARQAIDLWGEPLHLVGPKQVLESSIDTDQITIVHAPDVIGMADKPAEAARRKPDNSMAVGMQLLKRGEADAFVTMGNTGGAMAAAVFGLGRLKGLKRPALSPILPVREGTAVVLDIGANADCRPEHILQFARMGSTYAQIVLGRDEPRVGLLGSGEEQGKGNELVRQSLPLLLESGLNFVGNLEPKDLYAGDADVVVTDGFTGNIFLKTSEAVAAFLVDIIRSEIRSSPLTAIGGWLAKPAFRRVFRILDPGEYGAVPLLGIDGLVFIGHGRSDDWAVLNAIRAARRAVSRGLMQAMREAIRLAPQESGG